MALAKMPLWQLLYFEDLPFLQKPVLKINRFSKHFQQKKNKVYIISRVYIYIYIYFLTPYLSRINVLKRFIAELANLHDIR